MAVTSHLYPAYQKLLLTGKTVDMDADTIKMGLCTASAATWGATQQAYQYVSSVTGAYTEVTGGGYARVTLASLALTISTNTIKWTCTSPIVYGTSVSIAAASAFIFDSSIGAGSDAATPVIAIIDFGGTQTSVSGTWEYTIDPSLGLATFTCS
jgi:hypothetical protein